MTGPLIPKGAAGADPGEELAESPAGETTAGSAPPPPASPPVDAGAAVDDDAGGPITPIFSNEPLRGRRSKRPAPARAPSAGAATGLPELTVLTRALGVLALCGWSVGVVVGVLMIKGNTEQFLLSNFFGNTGRMFLLGGHGGGRGRRRSGGADLLPDGPARAKAPSACTRSRSAYRRSRWSASCRFCSAGAPGTAAISRSCSWSRSSLCARARR